MRKRATPFIYCSFLFCSCAIAQIPRPDHVLVAIFENRGYSQMMSTMNAPYIHSLIADANTATFSQSFAIGHPSQPNYLRLYSGSSQGVTTDTIPTNTPFTTCNLGASLLSKGFSFKAYNEDMPYEGFLGKYQSPYFRRHNPCSNWQGTGVNNIPPSCNQPFTAYPANLTQLPDVCFVSPNIVNCMHDGSTRQGDDWLSFHLKGYIEWAKTHNSLFILTFDEDDGNEGDHILTLFNGPMVNGGSYSNTINHYSVLRTLEDMYGLEHCGNAGNLQPITGVWKSTATTMKDSHETFISKIYPAPAKETVNIIVQSARECKTMLTVMNGSGEIVHEAETILLAGPNELTLKIEAPPGIYIVRLVSPAFSTIKKMVIE